MSLPLIVELRNEKLSNEKHAMVEAISISPALHQAVASSGYGCHVLTSQIHILRVPHCFMRSAQGFMSTTFAKLIDLEMGHVAAGVKW
jgi:hypothetical protein